MKKRVAIVRGPNLNTWEMQNFSPLLGSFEIVGLTSYIHNFDVSTIPFDVRQRVSVGQILRARILRSVMNRFLGDYHDLQGLGKVLRGFDIVHSAEPSYYCTYQAARSKEKLGFKLVVTAWENIPFLYHLPATKRNKEEVFRAADLFLPVSQRAKEVLILEGAPEAKVKVQMPGVDVQHFRPMEKDPQLLGRLGLKQSDVIVLFVANLYREKGIFDLMFAFRRLLSRPGKPSHIKLVIAGQGRERGAIARLLPELHLEDHVRLTGSHPYKDMPKIHNLADVFVLPSVPVPTWQEQFGYVLVESMACGKPVVSTASGSIPEVVGDAGMLVAPGDFVGLAGVLEELLASEEKRQRLGMLGRARAERLFDSRRVALQLQSHYDMLLGTTR